MEGARITREELKARWAFSEFRAERWVAEYARLSPEKIRPSIEFPELRSDELSHLAWMVENFRPTYSRELNVASVFECQKWSKEQLGRTYTTSIMAPSRNANIPFLSFLACPRFTEGVDPRVQADKIPYDASVEQKEPIIVLPYGTINILIDGYLRGILFMRGPDPDARILVWVPVRT
jgi:hypothetical protein